MMNTVQNAYTRWAATYDSDRNLTRDLDQMVMHTLLAGQHFNAVLELGCGTGKNTRLLASISDHVHALDFSEGMLAQAQTKQFDEHVRFAVADLTQPWPCADGSINLVVGNLVLEHIADLSFIFAEARRVLGPAGQLLICELHPFRQYGGSKAHFQHEDQQIEPTAFVHHLSEFFAAADQAGFTLIDLREWWHAEDSDTPPRLLSLRWTRQDEE